MNTTKQIIQLKEPVQWGSETISSLELRKPTIGDIKHMKLQETSIADILALASKLSGQSEKLIEMLSIEDGLEVANVVGNFLGGSRPIGSKALES